MRAWKSWRGNATEDRRLIGMGAGTTGKYNNRNRECPAEDRRPEGRGTYRHGGTQAPPLVAARAAVEPLAPPWMLAMSLASVAGGGSRAASRWGGGLPAMTPEARGDATIHGQGGNESFTFTRSHFCDFALMQRHPTEHLDVKVA